MPVILAGEEGYDVGRGLEPSFDLPGDYINHKHWCVRACLARLEVKHRTERPQGNDRYKTIKFTCG